MTGLFAEWQPRYAERGIATFPVREKKPAVKGYLKAGLSASRQFATRFPRENAFGLACRRNKLTVLDVDSTDERLLADAMHAVGPSPFIVRSASGNFQAWYRNSGEPRRVRPYPGRPIDILGNGFVVAPPSKAGCGAYEIIAGSLDDLAVLPAMRKRVEPEAAELATQRPLIGAGLRNDTLWRHCMIRARFCSDDEALVEEALSFNRRNFLEPLSVREVLGVAANAWRKQQAGENWFGDGGRVAFAADEIDGLLQTDPDGFVLLAVLRRNHWGREFAIANAMHKSMPSGGWRLKRFTGARSRLLAGGEIELVRQPGWNSPGFYRFKGGEK